MPRLDKPLPGQVLLTVLGILVSGGLVAVAVTRLDWLQVGESLGRSRLWPWVPIAVASYLTGHLLRGVRCRLLLSGAGLTTLTATNMVVVGYAVNNILPARAGELARAAMIKDRTGLPFAEALTVTFVERLLDGLAIVGLLLVGTRFAPLPAEWMRTSLWLVTALFVAGAAAIALLAIFPGVCRTLAWRLSTRLGPKGQRWFLGLVGQVIGGVRALGNPEAVLRIVALSAVIWVFEAGMFLALLPALGLGPSAATAAVTMAVTNLGLLVPSTPGFIGPFHFFCIQTLVALGAPAAPAFAYAVLVHATFYVPITLWGVGALFAYGVEFAALHSLTRAARALTPTRAAGDLDRAAPGAALLVVTLPAAVALPRPGPRSLVPVVHAFLVSTGPAYAGLAGAREAVERDVLVFVEGQVQALPNRFRLLTRAGLAFFGFAVRMRHPRGLRALTPERQVRVVEAWAFGRWATPRKLFRLIRSTALLAFYDHPAVQAVLEPELVSLGRRTSGAP